MKADIQQKRATTRKQSHRSLRRRAMTWGITFAAFGTLLSGCKLPFQPIPGVNRPGECYYYTKNYSGSPLGFNLLGKCLTASDGKFSIIPSLYAIFPGGPLFWSRTILSVQLSTQHLSRMTFVAEFGTRGSVLQTAA